MVDGVLNKDNYMYMFYRYICIREVTQNILIQATQWPRSVGFQAGPYFPNFPYFFRAALIFLIKASKS